jgi:general secretion pathway protein E
MGAPPYLIAGSLIGVVGQRLLRRACTACGGQGCTECGAAGYRGRVGAFEVMSVDAAVRELIMRRAGADALRVMARRTGMLGMADDAARKVAAGITTSAEAAPLLALLDEEMPLRTCSCGKSLELSWRWCPVCGHTT